MSVLPSDFLKSLNGISGLDVGSFLNAHEINEIPVSIRLNRAKPSCNFDLSDPVPWSLNGFYLPKRPRFSQDPFFHAGCYYVQEASSMFLENIIEQLCKRFEINTVLDLCAAPGGKTTILLSHLSKDSVIVANEIISKRLPPLQDNTQKWGSDNLIITNNRVDAFGKLQNFFDLMLVDAPCSGSGLFRKDAESIRHWSLNHVKSCSKRQVQILQQSLNSLKPGGFLIYSTCSYSKEENESISDMLFGMGYEPEKIAVNDSWGIVTLNDNKGFRFYPDKLRGEGFFAAVFRKPASAHSEDQMSKLLLKYRFENQLVKFLPVFSNEYEVQQRNGMYYLMPKKVLATELYLKKHGLNVVEGGVKSGEIKGDTFVPDHAFVYSDMALNNYENLSVDYDQAIAYLSGERLKIKPDNKHGWMIINYKGVSLGWYKFFGNGGNNYYPNFHRIRKRMNESG